ncbi:MAG: serine/threonine protein kinase [Myxococcales bacterium]|nr:serine/threonine protein kinase [Myxococcales bacterium]
MLPGVAVNAGQSTNTLGKYRLIAELGRGGMAEVYLAIVAGPAGFNKLLVVKCIRLHLAEDPDFLAMFLDEARLAARLNHPNIVQTIEVGNADGRYFIAMEYLEGQPLNRVLHRIGREQLPLGSHLRILVEALAGLHHAHELTDYDGTPLGVVHRDTSPHNTFVTYSGQVKVVDFGIAKAMNSSAETRTGVLKGKVAYMSPEQAQGDKVDRRADVYSAGVLLWEALAARRMWKGQSDIVVLNQLLSPTAEVPPPSSVRPVPQRLEQICMRALARDRDRRYATALELGRDLEDAMDALGMRGSTREAGELVGREFADERGKIKGIIEEQIRSASDMSTGE